MALPIFAKGVEGVLSGGDEDGDGLTNLEEYFLGTDIFVSDTDGDGLEDEDELLLGLKPLLWSSTIFVDAENGVDSNAGTSWLAPKCSLSSALAALPEEGMEFAVLVAPGVYSGPLNRNLSFGGRDTILRSRKGAFHTVVDLGLEDRFLRVEEGESESSTIDGFHLRRGCADQGGAILVKDSGLTVENCIFDGNCAADGSVIYASNSTLVLRNVLLEENAGMNAVQASALEVSGGTMAVMNCTLRQPVGGSVISGSGVCSIVNTILEGTVSASSVSATYCCFPLQYSGEGNIVGDAGLLVSGFLDATSPCIDAGTVSGAPTRDLYGFARSADMGIDIGCLEYQDLDGDGIVDSYEQILCGKDLLPEEDEDGDGLSNLQEYQAGLDAISSDTDGDGMGDGWEVSNGFDPRVDDAWLDADGDQLTNVEEFLRGLNPRNADTDGDGLDDFRELLIGLDPMDAADLEADEDEDGVPNGNEIQIYGTSHLDPDSDGDGVDDGAEIVCGMNPLVPAIRSTYGGGYAYEREMLAGASCESSWGVSGESQISLLADATWHVETEGAGAIVFSFPEGLDSKSKIFLEVKATASFVVELHFKDSSGVEFHSIFTDSACGSASADGNTRTVGLGAWCANGNWHPVLVDPVAELRGIAPSATMGTVTQVVFRGTLDVRELSQLRYVDMDHDGLPDSVETHGGLSSDSWLDAELDQDGDGLCNRHEFLYGTSITVADTDGDGLSDGEEVKSYGTNPLVPDQDCDGMADGWEMANFASLSRNGSADYDADGLSDFLEYFLGSDPLLPETSGTASQILLELYTLLANLVEE